jgi:hypothetical protein
MAVRLVQGEDITLIIKVKDKATQEPHQFDGFEGATAFIANSDGATDVAVSGSVLMCGKLAFPVRQAQSELFLVGDPLDFEYHFVQNGLLTKEKVEGQLTVEASLVK